MRLWRISNHADLSGEGGLRASARWHHKGRRVVYLADHPSSALLEILVHLEVDAEDLPTTYRLIAVDVPARLAVSTVAAADLPRNWRRRPSVTRKIGDDWLASTTNALLRVPSAIVPDAVNVLLNPGHPEARRVRIASASRRRFDRRLFG